MKTHELRELSLEELERHLYGLKDKLFDLRIKKATGSIQNTGEFKQLRKEIARTLTILNEKKNKKSLSRR